MDVNSINGNRTGVPALQMKMNQGTDAVSKDLQNQIANAQKQMQELGENKEMSLEEKMKKRQEIQQQISDLQNQLRQHQIEQRKENQQKSGSSLDDMLGGNRQTAQAQKGSAGISSASMQAIISADSSMHQVKAQGAVKSEMEGRAGVLESEIKLDGARGGDTTRKREELADVEAKVQDITSSQMEILSKTEKDLKEAAEDDREADKKVNRQDQTEDKDKADQFDQKLGARSDVATVDTDNTAEPVRYESVDVVSEGITVSNGTNEPAGNNVDVKV
ncbi:MAG: FlxA-like family protein [Lachnospiraceae bacterium]|nr:FlxA-like family protein [Lachnospiraceae bacterium]